MQNIRNIGHRLEKIGDLAVEAFHVGSIRDWGYNRLVSYPCLSRRHYGKTLCNTG